MEKGLLPLSAPVRAREDLRLTTRGCGEGGQKCDVCVLKRAWGHLSCELRPCWGAVREAMCVLAKAFGGSEVVVARLRRVEEQLGEGRNRARKREYCVGQPGLCGGLSLKKGGESWTQASVPRAAWSKSPGRWRRLGRSEAP